MNYGQYTFPCKFLNSAALPCYKGSTFRGVFGIDLKKISCTLKNNECESCLLKSHCTYALVFETDKATSVTKGSKLAAVPHPFVIEPPLTDRLLFKAGDPFDFDLKGRNWFSALYLFFPVEKAVLISGKSSCALF